MALWKRLARILGTGDCGLINIYALLVGLVGGLFAVYWTAPRRRVIEVTPSPENAEKIQYKDEADRFFEFREERVACDEKAVNHPATGGATTGASRLEKVHTSDKTPVYEGLRAAPLRAANRVLRGVPV